MGSGRERIGEHAAKAQSASLEAECFKTLTQSSLFPVTACAIRDSMRTAPLFATEGIA
jgi:hypothetical protein